MESEDRSSTGSTVSEVFKTILQSPMPVCMFYFSHPFGISSPAAIHKNASNKYSSGNQKRKRRTVQYKKVESTNGRGEAFNMAFNQSQIDNKSLSRPEMQKEQQVLKQRSETKQLSKCKIHNLPKKAQRESFDKQARLIPWPRDTWRRDYVLPPLIQFRRKNRGEAAPDLETILRTIRQAWNTPNTRSLLHSRSQEDSDTPLSSSSWNFSNHLRFHWKMGSGTNTAAPVASGLMRRRYSVPEIIMRKHSLSQQKSYDETIAASSPSPNISPLPGYPLSTPSTNHKSGIPMSSGSDSNLVYRGGENISMRKSTLLRRIWSRELKRYDTRSGSWSPPMRRSQRRIHMNSVDNLRCEECQKLDDSNDNMEEALPKRLRLIRSGKSTEDSTCNSSSLTPTLSSDRLSSSTERPDVSSSACDPCSKHTGRFEKNGRPNVQIYMTSVETDPSGSSDAGENIQDVLRIEFDSTEGELKDKNVGSIESRHSEPIIPKIKTDEDNGNSETSLDQFISKLLIDNLNDLASELSQFYGDNNSATTVTRDHQNNVNIPEIELDDSRSCANTKLVSETSNGNQSEVPVKPDSGKMIYFPNYLVECKEDMSSYNSNLSDFELMESPHNGLVNVTTGSTYLLSNRSESVIVPRILVKFPRTESLEAQPSSASALEENNDNESDESVSLVDSLDDIASPRNVEPVAELSLDTKIDSTEQKLEQKQIRFEKGEAFFVPIQDSSQEEAIEPPSIAVSMPAKLKEKIIQRQKDLDNKREEGQKKKQKKLETLMDPKLKDENYCEKVPSAKNSPVKEKHLGKAESHPVQKITPSTSKKNAVLRSEIGQLESYTIDSKGNMKFRAQNTEPAVKKTVAGKPPKIIRKTGVAAVRSVQPGSLFLQKKSGSQSKSKKSIRKDVQKMTIFQAQSDIITPDHENGPRRVYQKTEIQDGEKCIEILEIVECLESSPDLSPERQSIRHLNSSKSALSRRSRIPIPIYKVGRSAGFQKSIRYPMRESSPVPGKCLSQNLHDACSSKVDRVIAELLIDALNRPDEVGIEIVRSPKDISKCSRRQTSSRRSTPRRSGGSGKYQQIFEVIPEERSSISVDSSTDESTKLTKTNSEVGSSTTEVNIGEGSPRRVVTRTIAPTMNSLGNNSCNANGSTSTSTSSTTTTTTTSSDSQKTPNRGRAAVESMEPKAWIGFFKRHDGSSMDEDDSPSQGYKETSVEDSSQQTITSPSTVTAAAGTTTPIVTSSAVCPTSTESDNILTVLDTTFKDSPPFTTKTNKITPESNSTIPTTSTSYNKSKESFTELKTSDLCRKCKGRNDDTESSERAIKIEFEKLSNSEEISSSEVTMDTGLKQKLSTSKTVRQPKITHRHRSKKPPNVDIWRVQSPDICKKAIPNSKFQSHHPPYHVTCLPHDHHHETPSSNSTALETEYTSGIDSRSFIIVTDPSTTTNSSKEPTTETDLVEDRVRTPEMLRKCKTCCFCNPDIHNLKLDTLEKCVYCKRKKTPPRKEEETNTESDFFLTHFYQTMSKSDHTHTRTRSRDSDVVSTKCSKINEKTRRYIPENKAHENLADSEKSDKIDSKTKKNINRPKNVNSLPKSIKRTENKTLQDDVKTAEISSSQKGQDSNKNKDSKQFRFPSPYTSPNSNYDGTSSPESSSDSTCPTTPKKCPPVLPTNKRQSVSRNNESKLRGQKRPETQNADATSITNADASNGVIKTTTPNQGWSVTLAGSYNQNLAPDVEMRLSFPKQHQYQQIDEPKIRQFSKNIVGQNEFGATTNGNLYADSIIQDEDILNDNYMKNNYPHAALPPAGNINPKKALTRIVSERTQRDYNFPDVNSSRNQVVSRQTAKKAIKHLECSVVTSATRTISNFSRGRRTMSYHALNTESHKLTNQDRHIRDNSLDLGNLSSRMSLDGTQTPVDAMELSVLGNAIAPEQKPRVPTMSEKDLTRRHNGCFIRNRAFFT